MSCPKCGKSEPHFVGPSFGEAGFYICEQVEQQPPISSLRREAEALCIEIIAWLDLEEKNPGRWAGMQSIFIRHLKAQRREEVEAIKKYIAREVNNEMVCSPQSISVWLSQRKKELE